MQQHMLTKVSPKSSYLISNIFPLQLLTTVN